MSFPRSIGVFGYLLILIARSTRSIDSYVGSIGRSARSIDRGVGSIGRSADSISASSKSNVGRDGVRGTTSFLGALAAG